jgi:predicted transcriptional regulator
MAPRSSKKEFRTSVILTEAQHRRVLDIARANDASIAWVLRQALDRYLEAVAKEREAPNASDASDRH